MFECTKVNINEDPDWTRFLKTNYNLFFDPKFLVYNDLFSKRIKWHHLKFREEKTKKIAALLTGCERTDVNGKTFISCNGASFGGFTWSDKLDLIDYNEIIRTFRKYIKAQGFNRIILRNQPFIYQKNPDEEYEYALLHEGFSITKNSITNIVDLTNFEFEKLSNPKKRSIKKSDTNIEVKILDKELDEENFKEYYSVLLENRQLKNVTPTHSIKELIYLKNNLPDKIFLFYAEIEGVIAGICILFKVKEDVILNFYMATHEEYKRARVSDLILFKSIEWAKKNGYRVYDVGTSNIGYKFLEGLFSFKKKFMASGFLRKTYELYISGK
ncbi:MAG: GNAT family N-acetyltransferase [Ignavibacteriae bacterium]|nr:GNAT family N-acetyltransferase [Ignavibacteriota bacterium]MCB9242625.1 GNAT family N-acetyltransferase [Ignavibacteriales bacterium]